MRQHVERVLVKLHRILRANHFQTILKYSLEKIVLCVIPQRLGSSVQQSPTAEIHWASTKDNSVSIYSRLAGWRKLGMKTKWVHNNNVSMQKKNKLFWNMFYATKIRMFSCMTVWLSFEAELLCNRKATQSNCIWFGLYETVSERYSPVWCGGFHSSDFD